MNCKTCGSDYKTRELKCPYCGNVNLLGKLWQVEKTEAEKEYETAKKDYNKRVSPYVLNRLLSRAILICGLVCGLFVVGFTVVILIIGGGKTLYAKMDSKKLNATMEQYCEAEQWDELYAYMRKYDILGTERYRFSQAALFGSAFTNFQGDKLQFLALSEEEKQEDTRKLKDSIGSGLKLYHGKVGIYSDIDPENVAMHENFKEEVLSYFVGTLGLTMEELETALTETFISTEEEERLVALAKERRAWNE